MKTTLNNIASIQTGLFAKTFSEGSIAYLQAKDFDENGHLQAILHPDLKAEQVSPKHLLQPGDVLFAAKGSKNFAAIYETHNIPAVASTTFFVIRLNANSHNTILSEYLMWYLNNPTSQKFLKNAATVGTIPSISKAVLEELEISIPDLQTQKAILQITQLRNTEKKLMRKMESLREKQIQQQLINAIK